MLFFCCWKNSGQSGWNLFTWVFRQMFAYLSFILFFFLLRKIRFFLNFFVLFGKNGRSRIGAKQDNIGKHIVSANCEPHQHNKQKNMVRSKREPGFSKPNRKCNWFSCSFVYNNIPEHKYSSCLQNHNFFKCVECDNSKVHWFNFCPWFHCVNEFFEDILSNEKHIYTVEVYKNLLRLNNWMCTSICSSSTCFDFWLI